MDERKYEVALKVVANWIEEMMRSGYERKEALKTLLHVLNSGALMAVHPRVKEYEAEIGAAIRSQLGEMH